MRLNTVTPHEFVESLERSLDIEPDVLISSIGSFSEKYSHFFPEEFCPGEDQTTESPETIIGDDFIKQLHFMSELLLEVLNQPQITGLDPDMAYHGETYISTLQNLRNEQIRYVLNGITDLDEHAHISEEEFYHLREVLIIWAYFFLIEEDDGFDFDTDNDDNDDDEPSWTPDDSVKDRELVLV